jgi:CheY-like chemotaxis protein
MEPSSQDFLVIDDDRVNNMICTKIIQLTLNGATVNTFTEPEKGLEYILCTYSLVHARSAILFLDINMPTLTGWQVLDRFEKFPDSVKERVKIFILSSSVHPSDKEKAANNALLFSYITKPLTVEKLKTVLSIINNN